MHCEGCGFGLHSLECAVRGRARPNTDKWLFHKLCQEVNVEEVWTATLPDELVSGDEELDVLPNPLLASPPGKEVKKEEVQSSDSEVDLFAPPPYGACATEEGEGKEGFAKCPPKGEGKEGFAKCTPRSTLPPPKGVLEAPSQAKQPLWSWAIG